MTKKNSACHPVLALSSTVSKSCLYWCSSFTMLVEESYPNLAAKLVPKLEGNPVHGLGKFRWKSYIVQQHTTTLQVDWTCLKSSVQIPFRDQHSESNCIQQDAKMYIDVQPLSYTPIYIPHKGSCLKDVVCRRREAVKDPGHCKQVAFLTSPSQSAALIGSGLACVQAVAEASWSLQGLQDTQSTQHTGNRPGNPSGPLVVVHWVLAGWSEKFSPSQWKRSIQIKLIFTMLRPPPLGSVTFQVPAAAKPSLFNVNIPSGFQGQLIFCQFSLWLPLPHCNKFINHILGSFKMGKSKSRLFPRNNGSFSITKQRKKLNCLALYSCCVSDLSFGLTKLLGTFRSLPPCM